MVKKKSDKKAKKSFSTWKNIHQSIMAPSVTFTGLKRRMSVLLRYILLVLFLLLITGSVLFVAFYNDESKGVKEWLVSDEKLASIAFLSDGILKDDWALALLRFPEDTSLMSINIQQVKERLEAVSQIKSANVVKQFPSTLVIEVQEYEPLMRLVTRGKNRKFNMLVVSPEGIVFEPIGYTKSMIQNIPFIEGISLKRDPLSGFYPIKGMGLVAQLLKKARDNKPHLYADWRSVSLDGLDEDEASDWAMIKVKTRKTGNIIFSVRDFDAQLERLDYIISEAQEKNLAPIRRIDLSLGEHAAVQLSSRRR